MFKISTLRPLQFFAEHKFSQVAGEVFGARNRLNTRRTTPRPIHSKFKKFSRGTTPTARGVCFWAPGGRRHALGALRHERTHCRRAHRQQRGRFPPFSFVHPLFVLCATSTRGPIHHPRNTRNETHSRPLRGHAAPTPGAVSEKVPPQRPLHIANAFSSNNMDKLPPSTTRRTPTPGGTHFPSSPSPPARRRLRLPAARAI